MSEAHKKALKELVHELQNTIWSSWQSTARFDPALNAAIRLLEEDALRDSALELARELEEKRAEIEAIRQELENALTEIECMKHRSI